jgi:hypothetical protein
MGGFFGVAAKEGCLADGFYGTGYHSHLGNYAIATVGVVRSRCGATLARRFPSAIDFVAGIPDSGIGHGRLRRDGGMDPPPAGPDHAQVPGAGRPVAGHRPAEKQALHALLGRSRIETNYRDE